MTTMYTTINRYFVYCKSRFYPQYGERRVVVTAPTKKWIRDNWFTIAGTNEYSIKDIVKIS